MNIKAARLVVSFQVVPVECASTVMIVDCPSRLQLQPGHEHCARVTSIIVAKQADYWHNIGRELYTKRQRCYPLELEKTTQQLASPFAISPPPHHGHMTATSAFAMEDSESRRGRAGGVDIATCEAFAFIELLPI